jgi:hypothetical protein
MGSKQHSRVRYLASAAGNHTADTEHNAVSHIRGHGSHDASLYEGFQAGIVHWAMPRNWLKQ